MILIFTLHAEGKEGLSGIPERKTYLPEYRMEQMFPTDITGSVLWYDMNPFPGKGIDFLNRNTMMPGDYRQSRSEYLMGNFDEILYFTVRFSHENLLDIENTDRQNLRFLSRISELYNTDITLCLTGSSDEILPLVQDPEKREQTIGAIASVLENYNIRGIDLDWEFPRNDNEKLLHQQFMQDLKDLCSEKDKTLSMAVSRFRLLPEETYSIPDRINLMTYDFYGRHSTWEGTLEAIEYMMARYEIPPEKLLMGLPFYGRIFDGYSPDYWKKTQSYREIVRNFSPTAQEDEAGGYFFNGPATVQRKLELASDHNLQGVFIWEIGQDMLNEASLSRVVLDY